MTGLEAAAEAATLVSAADAAAQAERARADGLAAGRREQEQVERNAQTQGAQAAQARIRAILTAPAAAGRTAMAEHLAFETQMPAPEAIALMEVSPAAAPAQRASRINAPSPRIDAGEAGDASADPFAPRVLGQASPSMRRLLANQGQQPLELIPGSYWLPDFARGAQ